MEVLKTTMPTGCELSYRDHFGSDLEVCNDAYVSTGKLITALEPKHRKFILSLARRGHTSPFRHCKIKVFVKNDTFHVLTPSLIAVNHAVTSLCNSSSNAASIVRPARSKVMQ